MFRGSAYQGKITAEFQDFGFPDHIPMVRAAGNIDGNPTVFQALEELTRTCNQKVIWFFLPAFHICNTLADLFHKACIILILVPPAIMAFLVEVEVLHLSGKPVHLVYGLDSCGFLNIFLD